MQVSLVFYSWMGFYFQAICKWSTLGLIMSLQFSIPLLISYYTSTAWASPYHARRQLHHSYATPFNSCAPPLNPCTAPLNPCAPPLNPCAPPFNSCAVPFNSGYTIQFMCITIQFLCYTIHFMWCTIHNMYRTIQYMRCTIKIMNCTIIYMRCTIKKIMYCTIIHVWQYTHFNSALHHWLSNSITAAPTSNLTDSNEKKKCIEAGVHTRSWERWRFLLLFVLVKYNRGMISLSIAIWISCVSVRWFRRLVTLMICKWESHLGNSTVNQLNP